MIIVAACQLQRFGASVWPKHCSSDMLIGTSKSWEDPPSDHLMLRDHCCLPHLLSLPTTADAPLLARFLSPADTETQQQPMPINTLTTCCLPWRKPSCIAGVFTFLFLFSVSPLLSRWPILPSIHRLLSSLPYFFVHWSLLQINWMASFPGTQYR